MSINREIYQCARLLIDKYGEDGAIDHCDRRIVHHVDEQDTDGVDVWKGTPGLYLHPSIMSAMRGLRRRFQRNFHNQKFDVRLYGPQQK